MKVKRFFMKVLAKILSLIDGKDRFVDSYGNCWFIVDTYDPDEE